MPEFFDPYERDNDFEQRAKKLQQKLRELREKNSKKFAILGIVVFGATVLFWVTPWIINSASTVEKQSLDFGKTKAAINDTVTKEFTLKKGGLYTFIVHPDASTIHYKDKSIERGVYAELIDEEGERIYSFKNFYDKTYFQSKKDVEYDIPMTMHINETGKYKMRVIAPSKPILGFKFRVEKHVGGGLYFGYYKWIFLAAAILMLISGGTIGSWSDWLESIKKKTVELKNWQTIVAFGILLVYAGCMVIAFTHYGYAGFGDYNHAPTTWFEDQYVYYLGP